MIGKQKRQIPLAEPAIYNRNYQQADHYVRHEFYTP
jgi:hypothetical protein